MRGPDHRVEVAIRGDDEAGATSAHEIGAEGEVLAGLYDPEKLELRGGAQIADFVQEEGAVPGLVDQALEVRVGAGIGAFSVPE